MLELVKFLDVFCVDYPELWIKVDLRILEFCEKMNTAEKIEFIARISNQGEGSDKNYDQVERILTPGVPGMSAKQAVMVMQGYYNTRHGTGDFFELLIKHIRTEVEKDDFCDMEVAVRMSLILNDSGQDLLDFVKDFYSILETKILANLDKLEFENAALLAHGYGGERGSKLLFEKLEEICLRNPDNLELPDIKAILYGFVFNYRITDQNMDLAIKKVQAFANQ